MEWGPIREQNQVGPYAHLRALSNDNYIVYRRQSSTLPEYTFNPNQPTNTFDNVETHRF
jgi:hypothetical protein